MTTFTLFIKKHKIIQLLLALLMCFGSFAQVQQTFIPRFNETVNGNFTTIGNNVLSLTTTGNYNDQGGNHNFTTVYVDIDGDTGIGSSTFNSSSANFTNPEPLNQCLSIRKAYLYWAAADREPGDSNSDNQPGWNYNEVKLMLPGQSTYTTVLGTTIYRGRNTHFSNDPYICVKDITNEVKALSSAYGKYQVANVEAKVGTLTAHAGGNSNTGTSGGWQIVFVYESPTLNSKNITIFDGYAHVTSVSNNFDILIDGFSTIPAGPVNANIVFGGLEGDRDISGDRLQIRNVAGNFVDISTPTRPANNFFNSKITNNSGDFIDRNPASLNTLGFDAGTFNLNNTGNTLITNNQTSATFRLASNQETYGMYLLGMAVDVFEPSIRPLKLNLNTTNLTESPGSSIPFQFKLQNTGNDNIQNLKISTILAPQFSLSTLGTLPPGVSYTYNATTRFLEFTIEDARMVVGSPELIVNFNLALASECYFLTTACDLNLEIQFEGTYNGVINTNTQKTVSSENLDSCEVGDEEPTKIVILQPSANWLTPENQLNRTIECNDSSALMAAQNLVPSVDKCTFTLNKVSGNFVSNGCGNSGTYTNTWTFTDACGVTSSPYVQTITVQDTSNPIISGTIPVTTIDGCSAADVTPAVTTVTALEALGLNISDCTPDTNLVITSSDTSSGTCPIVVTRTYTITDACNNFETVTQTININDTSKPVITGSLSSTSVQGCSVADVTPAVTTVADLEALGLSISDCTPDENLVVTSSDTSSGTCPIVVTRTYTITDACNNFENVTQTLNINDTTPPSLTGTIPAGATNQNLCFSAIPVGPTIADIATQYTDNCGSTITVIKSGTPSGNDCAWSVTYTYTVADECGNTINSPILITYSGGDITAPVLTVPATVTVECDEIPAVGVPTATDNCDATVTITYDGETRTNGICEDTYTLTRTWTATDNCGNATSLSQTISVQDTTAPVLTVPATVTVECDEIPAVGVPTATDNCDATVTIVYDGETRTNGICEDTYTLTRTWTATDNCGNATSLSQTINVQDTTAPIITCPANIITTADLGQPNASVTIGLPIVSDNCDTNVTFTNSFNGTQNASGTYNLGTTTVTYTATDNCGNTIQCSFTVTVNDNEAPEINCPPATTVSCITLVPDAFQNYNEFVAAGGTATDNNGINEASFALVSQTSNNNSCPETISRVYTISDNDGNSSECTHTIIVNDDINPVLTIPADVTVECDEIPAVGVPTATDNCDTNVTIVYDGETRTNGICEDTYTLTRTWTATDNCGNATSLSQTINVQDTTAPVLTVPASVTVECDEIPAVGVPTATDNCDATVTIVYDGETRTNGICENTYTLTRTWTATDNCGNATSLSQTINPSALIIVVMLLIITNNQCARYYCTCINGACFCHCRM